MDALNALLQWTPSGWTAEQISKLRELSSSGLTCREIAAQLGKTRNAIIGKLHRLGISVPKKLKQSIDERHAKHAECQRRYRKSPEGKEGRRRYEQSPKRKEYLWRYYELHSPRQQVLAAAKQVRPLNIRLIKLKPKQCRQPYGDKAPFLFCGRKTIGRLSYCAAHVRLNYRPFVSR